jgi:Protein of unknown function (DUF998)
MAGPKMGQPGRLVGVPRAGPVQEHLRRLAGPAAFSVRAEGTVPWWAVFSAGLAPVLLIGAWLAADTVQPASYSPIRQTISVLAGDAGTDRWIMTGTLFLVGGSYLVTAAGLAGVRAPARTMLAISGVSTIGIAASPEPASGPTPQHLAWTVLGAVTIAVWPALAARRLPPRPLVLSGCVSAAVTVVFAALLGWLFIEAQGGGDLGLAERLTTSAQACWPFVVALALRCGTSGLGGKKRPTGG